MMRGMRVGFVGFGRMGAALARGAVSARVLSPRAIYVWDTAPAARRAARRMGAVLADGVACVIVRCDVIFLCVKPGQAPAVLGEIKAALRGPRPPCVISIVAGLPIARIRAALGRAVPVMRAMPNTPALANAGMTAFSVGPGAARYAARASFIFSAVGCAARVPERWMNAVTAVSGSGPAYVFALAEAMIAAARALRIPEAAARTWVAQTVFGAGVLLKTRTEGPAALRRQVTSPGGTTEAALRVWQARAMHRGVIAAVTRAAARSRELERV